jgi:hypothetical protein
LAISEEKDDEGAPPSPVSVLEMSSVLSNKSWLPPPEQVLAGCCLQRSGKAMHPRIDGKPALTPPPEAPKANFIEQSVEKLKAVGAATADGAAFVGKKSLEGAKAVGDGAKAVGDGVSNLLGTGLYKVGVTAGLRAVFDEGLQGAKTEASSVDAGARARRSELDAAVAKVAAYEHYMLCTEGATDEFSELLRSSLGVTQRQHQMLARLLLHTEGGPVPIPRDTVQRWLPAYRAIVLIQASALSADSASRPFLARQRLLLVLALDGSDGGASVANAIDLYAARLLEGHTERAQDDVPLPIDFIAPIDAATVATTAAAATGGNEWQMVIWDTLTATKALGHPWPAPLAFQLYAELVRAVALEPLLEPALSRTAEGSGTGSAIEGPGGGGGGGGGGHGGVWYEWLPASNEAQSRALPALHRVWPSLRLDARTHALARLHVLVNAFGARVHALRTFSEAHPLEPAWQEQLNTALIAAVWAELTHRSSADEDAEADARVAHAAAAKARLDHRLPRCATLGESGAAAATLIQRAAREAALTRRLRDYKTKPRHPWRAADRLASTSADLAAELAEVLRDFRYLGGCSGRAELPRLVGTWRLATLTAIVLNRAGPTERAAALQHLHGIITPGAKSDARPAISSSGRIVTKFHTLAQASALRSLLGSSERKVEALTTALIARSVASHLERLRALGTAMSHAALSTALAPVAQGPTSTAAAASPNAPVPQLPNDSSKRNIFEQSVDKVRAVGTATVDGAKAVGTATFDGAKAVGTATFDGAKAVGTATVDGAKAVGTATRDAAAAAATGDKEAVAKAVAMGAGVTAATALAVVMLPVALPAAAAVASVAAAHAAVATAATATAAGAATAAAATATLPAAAAVVVGAHATAVAVGVGAAATAGAVALGKSGTGAEGFEGRPLRSAWLEKLPSWEIGDEL